MEEPMKKFSKSMGVFCNHLQSSSEALKLSVERRPIPLDSASSTFIQSLNRRISSTSTELNLLETMSFGTVSFEELLGHCNEIYKKNQDDLLELQDRLRSSGYVPEIEIDEDDNEASGLSTPRFMESKHSDDGLDPLSSYSHSIIKSLEDDSLLDESLSLKKLGLSDICLATLAAEGKVKDQDTEAPEMGNCKPLDIKATIQPVSGSTKFSDVEAPTDPQTEIAHGHVITLSKEDYENLPSYMKCLASWEDLLGAIEKFNSFLNKKQRTKGCYYFHQDEIRSVGLGHKEKAYMLLLMRMNRFVIETSDGVISYRVV